MPWIESICPSFSAAPLTRQSVWTIRSTFDGVRKGGGVLEDGICWAWLLAVSAAIFCSLIDFDGRNRCNTFIT